MPIRSTRTSISGGRTPEFERQDCRRPRVQISLARRISVAAHGQSHTPSNQLVHNWKDRAIPRLSTDIINSTNISRFSTEHATVRCSYIFSLAFCLVRGAVAYAEFRVWMRYSLENASESVESSSTKCVVWFLTTGAWLSSWFVWPGYVLLMGDL